MTDLVSLEGRTIIVTGAAQGIGKAITELAIGLGGAVVALDLNGDALKTAVGSLPSERVMTVTGSVVDADLAAHTVEAAVKQFGEHGAAELSYLVGLYCMVSVTLNTFDVPVPEPES